VPSSSVTYLARTKSESRSMKGWQALELGPAERGQDLGRGPAELLGHDREQPLGHDVDVAADVGRGVLGLGMEGDGHVGRQGPGGRRPDDDVGAAAGQRRELRAEVGRDLEPDVDRGRGLVPILDLGLGQGGPAVDAPVDGPFPLIDLAVFEERRQVLEDLGLVGRVHGQVGRRPGAEHAEATELLALDADEPLGVIAAFLADGGHGQGLLLLAEVLVDVDLDGQAVAVPAGDVRGVMPEHGIGLDDEVLEDLVHRRAQVDVAVGIGGAVVEEEGRAAGGGPFLEDPFVETHGLPRLDGLRLPLGQVGFHGEIGAGQVERTLHVRLVGHRGSPVLEI
jgi:hypothetical protein